MRLLLDTHIVVWFIAGSNRISNELRVMLTDETNDGFVSVVTGWEIAIKVGLGHFEELPPDVRLWFAAELDIAGFTVLPISLDHALAVETLPLHHRDPFEPAADRAGTDRGHDTGDRRSPNPAVRRTPATRLMAGTSMGERLRARGRSSRCRSGRSSPAGWLLDQLQIQAEGLTGHLDEFWPDVARSQWIGGDIEGWEARTVLARRP